MIYIFGFYSLLIITRPGKCVLATRFSTTVCGRRPYSYAVTAPRFALNRGELEKRTGKGVGANPKALTNGGDRDGARILLR
jgi:hypothetical protein